MIYTITFNPALDYISNVKNFSVGQINRTQNEKILAGGKGLNVSIVLKNLGVENTAIAFIAGFTGEELERIIKQKEIKTNFIKVKNGITRINVKVTSDDSETAINGNGPRIDVNDIEELMEKIKNIQSDDMVILSGNVPKCIDEDIYEKISKELSDRGIKFIIDASRKLLLESLKYKPLLIKPNKQELEETYNVKINTDEDIIFFGKKLQEKGAKNVLISLGEDGAILITESEDVYHAKAPKGKVVTTVGAGDSMVAGFVAGYIKDNNYIQALKLGVAAGSASTFSEGLATQEDIEKIIDKVEVNKIL